MASSLVTYRASLKVYLKDAIAVLTDPGDLTQALVKASEKYNRRRPFRKTVELAGSSDRKVAVPSDWLENFSEIVAIEYPLNETPTSYIYKKFYRIKAEPSGLLIEFLDDYPGDSSNFYLTYTIRHSITEAASTVYAHDEEIFVTLAASYAAEMIESKYSDTVDSEMGADAVGFRDKAEKFASLSRQYREEFDKLLPKRKVGGFADWDVGLQAGTPQMFHNNR